MEALDTPLETIETENDPVGCDGGGGALGHPMVYLTMGEAGAVDCPYCSRHFTLKAGAATGTHGH